jgi:hypothetical protein
LEESIVKTKWIIAALLAALCAQPAPSRAQTTSSTIAFADATGIDTGNATTLATASKMLGAAARQRGILWVFLGRPVMMPAGTVAVDLSAVLNPLRSTQRNAGTAALSALKRMQSVAALSPSYEDYANRLLNFKAEWTVALQRLPSSRAKTELMAAARAYSDAGAVWQAGLVNRPVGEYQKAVGPILARYQFTLPAPSDTAPENVGPATFDRLVGQALRKMWRSADMHIAAAQAAMK